MLAVPVTTLIGALVATAASATTAAPARAPEPVPSAEDLEAERRRERLRAIRQGQTTGARVDPPRPRDPG